MLSIDYCSKFLGSRYTQAIGTVSPFLHSPYLRFLYNDLVIFLCIDIFYFPTVKACSQIVICRNYNRVGKCRIDTIDVICYFVQPLILNDPLRAFKLIAATIVIQRGSHSIASSNLKKQLGR